jgi:Uma2 family endonuclease
MERVAEEAADYGARVHAEERVIMHDISWDTFERLLAERGEKPLPLFAYDEGTLEIMSPYYPHETSKVLIGQMIQILTEEYGLKRKSVGSVTCKLKAKKKGLEPDTSFYIQNAKAMLGVKDLDLSIHPPPDLMVEIDISRSSMNKTGIYATLKVPEVWRFNGSTLRIFVLKKTDYVEVSESPTFPGLRLQQEIPRFISISSDSLEEDLLDEFRAWVKKNKK